MKNLIFEFQFFNQRWNLYIKSEDARLYEQREVVQTQSFMLSFGDVFLRKYKVNNLSVPLYSFGLLLHNKEKRAGTSSGEWSSRAGLVNKLAGTKLFELAFNNVAYAMDISDIKKLCPEVDFVQEKRTDGEVIFRAVVANPLNRSRVEFIHEHAA